MWYHYPELMPKKHAPLEVLTSHGIRQVAFDQNSIAGYRFTDCTHPLQNANCNMYAVEGWRYKEAELNTPENVRLMQTMHISFGESEPYLFTLSKLPWYIRLWNFGVGIFHPKTAHR